MRADDWPIPLGQWNKHVALERPCGKALARIGDMNQAEHLRLTRTPRIDMYVATAANGRSVLQRVLSVGER